MQKVIKSPISREEAGRIATTRAIEFLRHVHLLGQQQDFLFEPFRIEFHAQFARPIPVTLAQQAGDLRQLRAKSRQQRLRCRATFRDQRADARSFPFSRVDERRQGVVQERQQDPGEGVGIRNGAVEDAGPPQQVEGIDGDVTAEGHEKWIEVNSFSWGVGRGVTSPMGGSADREASAPSVSEITVTKVSDKSTANLIREALWGEGKKVKIDFCKTDKDKFEPYLQLELENTLISNYSVSGHGGVGHSQPMESLSLNFSKITFNDISMGSKNETGDPDRVWYDLAKGKGS